MKTVDEIFGEYRNLTQKEYWGKWEAYRLKHSDHEGEEYSSKDFKAEILSEREKLYRHKVPQSALDGQNSNGTITYTNDFLQQVGDNLQYAQKRYKKSSSPIAQYLTHEVVEIREEFREAIKNKQIEMPYLPEALEYSNEMIAEFLGKYAGYMDVFGGVAQIQKNISGWQSSPSRHSET